MQIPLCVQISHTLLFDDHFYIIFSAYELYVDPKSDEVSSSVTHVGSPQAKQEIPTSCAERFKRAFSYKDVRVHFVGAWYVIHILPLCNPVRSR